MQVKVTSDRLPYGLKHHERGSIIEVDDNDPCTKVMIDLGLVEPSDAQPKSAGSKKKTSKKKYKTRKLTAE